MTFTIVFERGDGGGWGGTVPELPGLLLLGDTREALVESAPGAIADYVDALRSTGRPLPNAGELIARVDVAVA